MPIATTLSGEDDDDHGNPSVDNGNGGDRHRADPNHCPQRRRQQRSASPPSVSMMTAAAAVSTHHVVHNPPLTIPATTTPATMMTTSTPAPAGPDDHDTQPHRIDAGAPALVSTPFFFFHFFSLPNDDVPPVPAYQGQHVITGKYSLFIPLNLFFNTVRRPQHSQPNVDDDEDPLVAVASPIPSPLSASGCRLLTTAYQCQQVCFFYLSIFYLLFLFSTAPMTQPSP